jgi:hypothetical protein
MPDACFAALQAHDSLTVWRRVGASAESPPTPAAGRDSVATDAAEPPPGAAAARAALLAHQDAAWAQAAAAHIVSRVAAGGPRAAPGPERAAVEAAKRGAPLLRRLLLRALC